jgi:HSP20 family protein
MRTKKLPFWFEEPEEGLKRFERDFRGKEIEMKNPFKISFPEIILEKLLRTIPISMAESENELLLKAELPGFSKDDIKLKITPKSISIFAEKKMANIEKGENFLKQEKSMNAVSRIFTLPIEIKPEDVKAKFERGVLNIEMQKKEKEERVK